MSLLIIWDWDNTLMNTRPAVKAGLQDLVNHHQLEPITDADVFNVMTSHRGDFWKARFGDNIPDAVAYYVQCYQQHADLVQPFEHTLNILNCVRENNIRQVILSNKNHASLVQEVARHQLTNYFDAILGTSGPLGKPDKAFVEPILEKFNPSKIVLIGDGISDMLMAQNINATAILVHRPDATDLPCHFSCETLKDVEAVLTTHIFK